MNLDKDFMTSMTEMKKNYPAECFKDRAVYADWLAQTYYFVCHSTELLGYALPHLKLPELKHRFEKHISEEERHEIMAKKDLEKLGFKLEDFPEHPETQAFYQSQFYRIQFEGGTSLLGYILLLEGLAVHWAKDLAKIVKTQFPESMVFLHVHTTEDPAHLEHALKSIKMLSPLEQQSILRNLQYSSVMYQHIMQRAQTNKKLALVA